MSVVINFFRVFGIAFVAILIPYSGFFLGQLVVGVATEMGRSGRSIRHRDDPKGFWRLIGYQFLSLLAVCLLVALICVVPR